MAVKGAKGELVSFDSEDMIEELKKDIEEFGPEEVLYIVTKMIDGAEIITNYDFIVPEDQVDASELKPGEQLHTMRADLLLERLIEQDSVI